MFNSHNCNSFTYLKNIDYFTREIDPHLIKKLIKYNFTNIPPESVGFDATQIPSLPTIDQPLNNFESTLLATPNVDITKCHTAFGQLAIPKLKTKLLHHDLVVSRQAIITLLDLVHDPEKATEAIRVNVLPRLVRLIISEDTYTRQHSLCVLKVLASQPSGPKAIVEKKYILKNLMVALTDKNHLARLQAALTCNYLAKGWPSHKCLVDNGYVQHILRCICTEKQTSIQVTLLNALENLLEKSDAAKDIAIDECICYKLEPFIKHKCSRVRAAAIAVLGQLFVSANGKKAGERCSVDLILWFTDCLEDKHEDVVQEAAIALNYLFITTPCKFRGVQHNTLKKLLPLALCSKNIGIASSAIQAITNLAAVPSVKDYLGKNSLEQINNINTLCNPLLTGCKERLINVVTYNV